MKKQVAINVHIDGKDYTSSYEDYSSKDLVHLENLIIDVCTNKCDFFVISTVEKKVFFGKQVLDRAIITLLYF